MTDPSQLQRLLARVRLLMLDFDGPVCSIFAGYPAPTVAADLRRLVARSGHALTRELLSTDDPLNVLRLVSSRYDTDLTKKVASALRDAELHAAETAKPTPGVNELLLAAVRTGRSLAIVSNNSREAVTAYLARHSLLAYFDAVVGRRIEDPPTLLKPHPYLLQLAMEEVQIPANSAVLVGDSITDIVAAQAASVPSIAYRASPASLSPLIDAGATAAIASLHDLAQVIDDTAVRLP